MGWSKLEKVATLVREKRNQIFHTLIRVCWNSCIEKVTLIRNLFGMLCDSLCVQEKVGKVKR